MDLYWSWVPGLPRKLYWPVRVISWDELKVKVFCKADNAILQFCLEYYSKSISDETDINENADDPMIDAGEPKADEGVSKTIKSENCCIYDRQVALLCHKFHDDEEAMKAKRGKEILKYGMPDIGQHVRYYSNHALVYDQQKRTPVWVAEHLTKKRLEGSVSRKNIKFKPDPKIEETFSAENSDYLGSGWSRGHLNPAGDNKHNLDAMAESFYLSNIVPQNYENNAGFWNRLEMYCRDLTKKYSNVYIISGPLMVPETTEDGKKFVKYQVIGKNEVAVPTHLYKVIIVEDKDSKPLAYAAFVIPNKPLGYGYKLTDFQVDIQELERMAGARLTPNFDQKSVENLCKHDGCKLIERTEFELYFIGRRLDTANTPERLEKVWSELKDKKLEPTEYLIELYEKKKEELKNKKAETDS